MALLWIEGFEGFGTTTGAAPKPAGAMGRKYPFIAQEGSMDIETGRDGGYCIELATTAWFGTPVLKKWLRENKIKNLVKERESIKKQIKENEEKRCVKKEMSDKEYVQTRKEFERRIEEIEETITVLKRKPKKHKKKTK